MKIKNFLNYIRYIMWSGGIQHRDLAEISCLNQSLFLHHFRPFGEFLAKFLQIITVGVKLKFPFTVLGLYTV